MNENIDFRLNCWYTPCQLEEPNCKKTCHRYLEMCCLITNCGMKHAEKYLKSINAAKIDKDAFDRLAVIKNNILPFVEEGHNLTIKSLFLQTGKTTWALKMLYKYFDEIWSGNGFRPRGYFLYVPEFLNKTKTFAFRDTNEFKKMDRLLRTVDLVIWDGITENTLSANEQIMLNTYIDKRLLEGKANIFTGMFINAQDELKNLGNKLKARLDSCENILIRGQSIR